MFIAYMHTIWQSLTDYQRLLPVVPFARHTRRSLLRRRRTATNQLGARREVSHLRSDPARAAEGRGHCCIMPTLPSDVTTRVENGCSLHWTVSRNFDMQPSVFLAKHTCHSSINTLFPWNEINIIVSPSFLHFWECYFSCTSTLNLRITGRNFPWF
jgi:hypothetical protein